MFESIKARILGSAEKKRVLSNILSLSVLQGVSYFLPLITFPYLVRVLGMENFGILAFATAVTAYFIAVTDYGFNLSATKDISIAREDRQEVSRIFSAVMMIKLILTVLCLFVLIVLTIVIEQFRENWQVFVLTFGMVIGQAMFPVWLFQGMERMKYITYIHILAKVFFTVCIFIFVKDASDILLVPLFNTLGYLIAGLISVYLAVKMFKVKFVAQDKKSLISQLVKGWHIFYSRIFVSLYSTTNIVILGFLTNNTMVGYYSVAEKIVQALTGLFQPVLQAVFPFLANIYSVSKDRFKSLFKKLNITILFFTSLIVIMTLMLSSWMVELVSGDSHPDVVVILMILSLSILLDPYGPSYTNGLVVVGESKRLVSVVKRTFIFNTVLVVPLIVFYGALGVAIATVVRSLYHYYIISSAYKSAVRLT